MRILAHRGGHRPGTVENTVPAVTAAFADGACGVEVDLRLSLDGVLVVCHDADLRRLCGSPFAVSSSSWGSLQEAGRRAGVPLARVEWVLAAAAGRRVVLELKAGPVHSAPALVDRLVELSSAGLATDVTVSSFDEQLVGRVRAGLDVRTALLGAPGRPASATLAAAVAAGHAEVHPHVSDLFEQPGVVEDAASLGAAVVPWTVNTPRTVRRCADLGVAALITDRPRVAARALAVAAAR